MMGSAVQSHADRRAAQGVPLAGVDALTRSRAMSLSRSTAEETLAAVVARAKAGDAAAFDELVDRFAGRLCGFFQRLLGRRADAEDLVQEVFVRLVQTLDRYEESGRFEPWIFRIAANLARSEARRNSRPAAVEREAPAGNRRMAADRDPLILREDLDRLQQGLNRLDAAEREVILLRHFGHLQFDEIAALMETPLGTALARGHRGLRKLREWVEKTS